MTKIALTLIAALFFSSTSAALAAPKALKIAPPAEATNKPGQGPQGGPLWNFGRGM
jgi:hypothetical protein